MIISGGGPNYKPGEGQDSRAAGREIIITAIYDIISGSLSQERMKMGR